MVRYEVRIGGFGGQGVVTMAVVAGETASLYDKKYVVQTQSYGPEARGGASKSEIVISDEEVDYPKVQAPDVFVVLSRAAYLEYVNGLKDDGILIIDPFRPNQNAVTKSHMVIVEHNSNHFIWIPVQPSGETRYLVSILAGINIPKIQKTLIRPQKLISCS